MDDSDVECELDSSSAESSVALIHDSVHRTERENLSAASEIGSREDENCLFQDEVRALHRSPLRSTGIRRRQKQKLMDSSALISSSGDSLDVLPLEKEVSECLENPYRKGRNQERTETRKIRSLVRGKGPRRKQTTTKRKPQYSVPLEERRRRLLDRGIQFPFTPFKYLPFKLYFTYEQFVLGGFLSHVKNLKYERTLKQSLKDMEVEEDLKSENLRMRQYSYLDEDGPLSPISEPGENLNEDEAEEEVKVVENSAFILDCQVPSKKKWQIQNKKSTHNES